MKSKTRILTICTCILITLFSCKKDNSDLISAVNAGNVDNAIADTTNDSTLTNALVAWYTFNGGDLSDQSGNGNNIVFCNATTTIGKKGIQRTAYLFNGHGNYMQVPNSSSLNPSSQITLAVLFKPKGYYTGASGNTRIFMKGNDDQSNGDYFLGFNTSAVLYGTYGDNQFQSAGVSSSAYSFQLNKWYKLIYTFNGSVAKLYINGALVNKVEETAIFTPNNSPLRIGKTGRTDFPYFFNGAIDEIRIYNAGLTGSQVLKVNSQLGQ